MGGQSVRVSLTAGATATIAVTNHPSYALSGDVKDRRLRVHISRIGIAGPSGAERLQELTVVELRPGEKKRVQSPTEITAIEWLAPAG